MSMGPAIKALTNERQRNFAMFYATEGLSATEAAQKAGYSAKTAGRQGHRLLTYAKIRAAVDEIADSVYDEAIMSRNHALEILTVIASDEDAHPANRIKAVDSMSKMCGWNSPDKSEDQLEIIVIPPAPVEPDDS